MASLSPLGPQQLWEEKKFLATIPDKKLVLRSHPRYSSITRGSLKIATGKCLLVSTLGQTLSYTILEHSGWQSLMPASRNSRVCGEMTSHWLAKKTLKWNEHLVRRNHLSSDQQKEVHLILSLKGRRSLPGRWRNNTPKWIGLGETESQLCSRDLKKQ